ncbi:helix-turn-helix domain-containing protein [Nocardiopsis nanhaiensis]
MPGQGAGRPIRPDERSGMLQPRNLERYRATWFDPAPDVRVAVDRYWCVRWNLAPWEALAQRVIDLPAVTLTVEEGDVPGPLVVTGVHRKAWRRRITGSGSVFAVRLRPAGLALLGDLRPSRVADATVVLTPELDPRLHSLMAGVAAGDTPEARARLADGMIGARLDGCRAGADLLLANAALTELADRVRSRAGQGLAARFGVSERTLQRAFGATLGHGPKWVSRRVRLQEVARVLATRPEVDLAALAAELGYADQAHLTNDFRGVAGITPGVYLRSLRSWGV